MATPGKPLDEPSRRRVQRLRDVNRSIRAIAADMGISTRTVQKYLRESRQAGLSTVTFSREYDAEDFL